MIINLWHNPEGEVMAGHSHSIERLYYSGTKIFFHQISWPVPLEHQWLGMNYMKIEIGEKHPAQTALFKHLYHYDPQGFLTHNLKSNRWKTHQMRGARVFTWDGNSVKLSWITDVTRLTQLSLKVDQLLRQTPALPRGIVALQTNKKCKQFSMCTQRSVQFE